MMYDHPFISPTSILCPEKITQLFLPLAGIRQKLRENKLSKIPSCIFQRFRVQYKGRKNQQYAKILMQF